MRYSTGKTDPLEKIGPRRLRAAIWLFVIAFIVFGNAGSDPACDYGDRPPQSSPDYWDWLAEEPDCEPDGWDEWGDDFLDATGFSKSTKNIIGFVFFMLAFYCWSYYHKTQKNEEPEKLPESFSEPEAEANWWEEETE